MTSTTSSQAKAAASEVVEAVKEKTPFLSPQVSSYFIAGGVAGAASRTVVSPLERLKIIQCVAVHRFVFLLLRLYRSPDGVGADGLCGGDVGMVDRYSRHRATSSIRACSGRS